MRWYFRVGDKTQGPISARRMRRFAAEGKLRPDHMVSSDERHWFRADQVFEFGAPARPARATGSGGTGETVETRPPARGLGLPLTVALVLAMVVGLLALARLVLRA